MLACIVSTNINALPVSLPENADIYTLETHELILHNNNYKHIIWEACEHPISLHLSLSQDDHISIEIKYTYFEAIKETIESCCLLETLEVYSFYNKEIEEWTRSLNGEFIEIAPNEPTCNKSLVFLGSTDFSKSIDTLAISNMCWNPKVDPSAFRILQLKGIKYINLTPTWYGKWFDIHRHFISAKLNELQSFDLAVLSINGIFYDRTENIFGDHHNYIEHFRKAVDYALILDAQYIIQGTSPCKIPQKSKYEEYRAFQQAHIVFVNTMQNMAEYLEKKRSNLRIVLKSSSQTNYLTENLHVSGMVARIDRDNIKAGVKRTGLISIHIPNEFIVVERV